MPEPMLPQWYVDQVQAKKQNKKLVVVLGLATSWEKMYWKYERKSSFPFSCLRLEIQAATPADLCLDTEALHYY